MVNSGTVSGGGDPTPNTDDDPTTVKSINLAIDKSHTGDFRQGQTGAQYTIAVTNNGPDPTNAAVGVTDSLPTGLTATAISGTGWNCTLATLTCTRSDVLAAGDSYPDITLTVDVANDAPASVVNSATVSGGGDPTPNTDNDPTTIRSINLAINKSHTGNFTQGQTGAEYTISVTNNGPDATSGQVTVTDSLPTGLTATAINGNGWNCTLATLTCTRSDSLANGDSYPDITLTVDVASDAPSTVINSATASGGGDPTPATDDDPTTVNTDVNLVVDKSHTGDFTQGQSGAEYTLSVTNNGPSATSGLVTITDTLPAGLTATAINGTGWNCTLATLTCTRSDSLASGDSYPDITLTVDVANNAPSTVINSATASGGGDPTPNTDNDPTTIRSINLAINKSHTGNFTQGQTGAEYTISVTNNGPDATSGQVTVTDALPAGLTATAINGTGWNCTLATLTCTRSDSLANGDSYPDITLTVDVASDAPSTVVNSATASGGGDPNPVTDDDPTTVIDPATPNLAIDKSHTGNFTQGQTGAEYTISVTNNGPAATTGQVSVTDTLPAGLTATAISGTGWNCTLATLTCTRSDSLANGDSYPDITLTVDVASDAPSTVINSATVSGGGDPTPATDDDPTTVNTDVNLVVDKSHTGDFTQGQSGAEYTLSVTNNGPSATSGLVTITDTLPAGLTATAISGTGWNCTLATLTCTRSDVLADGDSYPDITLTVDVASDAPSTVINSATVSGGGDPTPNTDNDPTTIRSINLAINKSHTGNFTQGQTGATYSIVVSNNGPDTTTGPVTVTDLLPAGLTATAINGSGWNCTLATLTCTRSNALSPGNNYPAITLTVDIASDAPSTVVNSATASGGGDPTPVTDEDPTTIIPSAPDVSLSINKSHVGDFTQGQTGAEYTIVVTNDGPDATSGLVSVTDNLPAGLTATAISGTGWNCTLATLTCTRSNTLLPGNDYPAITLTVDVGINAPASVIQRATVSGGGDPDETEVEDPTTIIPAGSDVNLVIDKSHNGNFTQGQTGATYSIQVSNNGPDSTTGQVTVTDTLPAGLTATAIGGKGWSCALATLTCTRSNTLGSGNNYPPITLTVDVAGDAPASVINSATVSGGGDPSPATDDDPTTIEPATSDVNLSIAKSHSGDFAQGETGATYSIVVSNDGPDPTDGLVTVTDTLPTGLTATAISGTGWDWHPGDADLHPVEHAFGRERLPGHHPDRGRRIRRARLGHPERDGLRRRRSRADDGRRSDHDHSFGHHRGSGHHEVRACFRQGRRAVRLHHGCRQQGSG